MNQVRGDIKMYEKVMYTVRFVGDLRKNVTKIPLFFQVPNCTFTIVQFIPDVSSGYERCLWAREWALVDETLLDRKDYSSSLLTESDEKLDCWFARKRSNLNPPGL